MASFDPVIARADRIAIIAGGPSAQALDFKHLENAAAAGVYIIAVNRAYEWLNVFNAWFTLDLDKKLIPFAREPHTTVDKYVAIPDDYGRPDARVAYHRDMARFWNVNYLRRVSGDGMLGSCPGLSSQVDSVHTGNSAYGALGLAYHMRPSRIALIGVDANRKIGYAYSTGKPHTTLQHLPDLFKSAIPQLHDAGIQVFNGSIGSLVECFPKCLPDEAISILMQ